MNAEEMLPSQRREKWRAALAQSPAKLGILVMWSLLHEAVRDVERLAQDNARLRAIVGERQEP